jgi:ATP-dependent RNA helicase DHX29
VYKQSFDIPEAESDDEASADGSQETLTGYSTHTLETVAKMDPCKINMDLIVHLINHIHNEEPAGPGNKGEYGSILVFLPGFAEISNLERLLQVEMAPRRTSKALKWLVLPLYSSLSSAGIALTNKDQAKVFSNPPNGYRKIVLSTNVAETGITIPDTVYVIDSMRAREISFDQKRNMKKLSDVIISKANAKQRRGRAGRVKPGYAYHFIPLASYNRLPDHRPPEMVRLPLEEMCLRARISLGSREEVGPLETVFDDMPDAPPKKNVDKAIALLKLVSMC